MATIVHYRNKLLQDAPIRVLDPSADKNVMIFADAKLFKVDVLGVASPSIIHFSAKTFNIPVFPTFSVSPGGTLSNITNTTCELHFNDMTVDLVKVYAKVTFEGIEYEAEETIQKVVESKRGPGAFYVTGDSWSDSAANAATLGDNLVGDTVTISNGMSYVEQKRWDGTAWVLLNIAVDGGKITLDSITASMIKDGVIDATKFASGIEPVAITDYVPTTKLTTTIYNTSDNKIYAWDAGQNKYVTQTLDMSELEGQLQDAQIAAVNASKITGQLLDAQIAAVNAAKIAGDLINATLPAAQVQGQLTDSQIAAVNAAKVNGALINANVPAANVTGQVVSSQIQNGAILYDKIAANAVRQENIAAGAITARQLAIGDFENLVNCGTGTSISGFNPSILTMSAQSIVDFNNYFWNTIGESSSYVLTWKGRNNEFGPEFPVQPGDEFFFSMLTVPNGGSASGGQPNNFPFSIGLIITDYAGNESYPAVALRPAGTTGVHKATGTYVVPQTITKAKVFFLINASDDTDWNIPGNSAHLAGIQVRKRNGGNLIVDGAITATKIAANSIDASKIQAGTITANEISAGAITAAKIAANTITSAQIAAGSIVADSIAASTITGDKLAVNSITTNKLLVTGKGKALNDDPSMSDSTAWTQGFSGGYFRAIDSPLGSNNCYTAPGKQELYSRNFTVMAGKRYKLSFVARSWQGISNCYARVHMKRYDNSLISFAVQGTTPLTTALEDITLTGTWTQYTGFIDAPTGAVIAQIALSLNFRFSDAICDVLDVRCEEYIGADLIVDGSISARHIAAATITAGQIAAGAITADQIAANSITAGKIQAGAIEVGKLAAGSVVALNMTADSVNANALAANSVTAGKVAANAITAGTIAANAVTAGTIAAAAINAREIAAGAITTDKLAIISRGMALNSDTAPSDVTAWDLAGGAGIEATYAATGSSSGNTLLASGTVTNVSTAAEKRVFPITAGKTYRVSINVRSLGPDSGRFYARVVRYNSSMGFLGETCGLESILTTQQWQTFTGTFVAEANAVVGRVALFLNWGTSGDNGTYVLAQNIRCEEVLPGTLIENGAITTVKIAAAAITADQIAANAVTADKITAGAITADKITAGAITAGKIDAGAVTADKISAGAITAGKIAVANLAAISSDLGAATAGSININNRFIVSSAGQVTITSPNTGGGYTITDSAGTRVYDGNNVLRVRLGIW